MICRGEWLLIGALCGCSQQSDILVVNVSNLPSRAVALSVRASLDGKTAMSSADITQPLDSFGVVVPGLSGHLTLDVNALDDDRCTQGVAQTSVDLPSPRVDSPLTAYLTAKSPRQCGALSPCAANTVCPLSSQPQKNPIYHLWAITPSDIWGVGELGTIIHFDGLAWSAVPSGVNFDLNDVWASSTTDVWAAGASANILHYNGTSWTSVSSGAIYPFNSIWGVSPTNIWAVGENSGAGTGEGEFWRWNGTNWTKVTTGIMGALYGIWASSPTNIFACGRGGLIMHFDGVIWKTLSSTTSNTLFGIWGSAPNLIFAVGQLGTVVRYDGTVWKNVAAGGTLQDLNSVFGDDNIVFITGNKGTLLRSSVAFDSFQSLPTGFSADLYSRVQLGSNGIGWLTGSSGTSGVLAYFDIRP